MDTERCFRQILQQSRQSELERLNRTYRILIPDEYVINEEIRQRLEQDQFEFPNAVEMKTDKRILIRKQDYFSAKIHVYEEALYFHRHEFVEGVYVYRGQCCQFLENFQQELILEEGDFFLMNQNVTHGILQKDPDAVVIKMIIPAAWMLYERVQGLKQAAAPFFDFWVTARSDSREYYQYLYYKGCGKQVRECVEHLVAEYYEQAECGEEAIRNYLSLLMIALLREQKPEKNCRIRLTRHGVENGELLQYIYEHSKEITLSMLAEHFAFHQSYMSRIIKETCGMNFQDVVKACRMEKTLHLLCTTRVSLEQIAQNVGYSNPTPIYQEIRKRFGMTPSEYRRKYGT